MAISPTWGADDAADTAVRLYGELVLALKKLETSESDRCGLAGDDGASLAARIRDLCSELEQLLDACEERTGYTAEWALQRIRAIEGDVSSVVRRVRSLVDRGRIARLDGGRQ
jgi:hypothetical protein